ncbi:hypothetical protein FisN_29Hh074 [Fistulifera solaris]|uniref:Sphingomyelin synthase-like domain-containing protein n=1 Tax=Fistulifera solaris TaxID=1519565 RepID=A0A1Z5K5X7_FISSO|nr:hypothetical protein FisN_29Hh074 [Fistulifera solaris]|eukprot:GAX21637.1 hypothetical protein FisN_29Hh074 [Fistulifera solaris]
MKSTLLPHFDSSMRKRTANSSSEARKEHDVRQHNNLRDRKRKHRHKSLILIAFIICSVLCFMYLFSGNRLRMLQAITLIPVVLCLWVAATAPTLSEKLFPITWVLSVISSQLPVFLAAFLAAIAILAFGLASTFYKQPKSRPSPTIVIKSVASLITVLLTENFMIWVVSATFPAGQLLGGAPPPLQDNGSYLIQEYIWTGLTKQEIVGGLRRLWNVQWSLVACLATAFAMIDLLSTKRDLYLISTRATWTLAGARLIRTISFSLTVLPNPRRQCYREHFPYPPPELFSKDWFWTGMLPNSNGGCNDLIISGHATVTTTLACVVTSTSTNRWFQVAVWWMLLQDYAVEIYEGFHYSVDMWMGLIVVSLLWRAMAPIEDIKVAETSPSTAAAITKPSLSEILMYVLPVLIAYIQLVLLPTWAANYLILLFLGVILSLYFKYGQARVSYVQHLCVTLLYLALGVYL